MVGFIHYTVPLSIKILICLVILLAIFIVYFWEPGRFRMNRRNKNSHALHYLDIDPEEQLAGKEKLLDPETKRMRLSHHITLQELDEYVKTLKSQKIRNLDEV